MKKKLQQELLSQLEEQWLRTIEEMAAFYEGAKPWDERIRQDLRAWFKSNPRRKHWADLLRRLPDERAGWFRDMVHSLPDETLRATLQDWCKSLGAASGGRDSLVPAPDRREIYREVKLLQKTMKRPFAIEQVAKVHSLKPSQVEGMLKHATRYKDTKPRRSMD